MRLYVLVSPTHSPLFQDWFLPSLKEHHGDRIEVQVRYIPQLCASGVYKEKGWTAAMLEKLSLIESAILENWRGEFVYSDVDVQFLGDCLPTFTSLSTEIDLHFQNDSPQGMLCAGFFHCRANERTLAFWRRAAQRLKEGAFTGDQDAVNSLLRDPRPAWRKGLSRLLEGSSVALPSFARLPDSFFSAGTFTGQIWTPGQAVVVPESALVHHANWTKGVAAKIAQLAEVKNQMEKRVPSIAASHGSVRQSTGVLPCPNPT